MTPFLRFLTTILLLSLCQGCKKEGTDFTPPKEDHSVFLSNRQFLFSGIIADSSVRWRYGLFEFQRGHGNIELPGDEPQERSFFWLTADTVSTRMEIYTSAYKNPDDLFSRVLAVGKKQLGSTDQTFALRFTLNHKEYTTNGDQENSVMEVLKSEKSKDEFGRDIALAWFKVDCKLYSTVDTSSFELRKGYILAGFLYNL